MAENLVQDALKCASAIVSQKLAQTFYNEEQFERCEIQLEKALQKFNQVSDVLKLRFINSIQCIYNQMGLVQGHRQAYDQSIRYFLKAQEIYNFVKQVSTNSLLLNTSFNNSFEDHLLT